MEIPCQIFQGVRTCVRKISHVHAAKHREQSREQRGLYRLCGLCGCAGCAGCASCVGCAGCMSCVGCVGCGGCMACCLRLLRFRTLLRLFQAARAVWVIWGTWERNVIAAVGDWFALSNSFVAVGHRLTFVELIRCSRPWAGFVELIRRFPFSAAQVSSPVSVAFDMEFPCQW